MVSQSMQSQEKIGNRFEGIMEIIFWSFYEIKVCCVLSLELPQ